MIENRLRQLREERGISQSDFARQTEVSRQTIHSIETGKYTPSVELALKTAALLGLKVEEVFSLPKTRGRKGTL